MEPFGRLTIVLSPRLRLGPILVPLLAFVLSGLPLLSAARHSVPKSSSENKTGQRKRSTKVVAKSSAKSPSQSAARKGPAKAPAKGGSTKSAGSAKGSKPGSLRAAQRNSKKGSSRTAAKRAKPTVYRQQQPEPERIREIQQALKDRGYPLEVNGAWDASTVDALKGFQTDQKIENLSGKGKLDSLTLIALGLGPKREPPSGSTEAPKQTPEGK